MSLTRLRACGARAGNSGGGIRTPDGLINSEMPCRLATPEELGAGAGVEPAVCAVYETAEAPGLFPAALAKALMDWVRLELTPNSLQDCRSAELSYQPEKNIAEAGLEPASCGL